MLTIVYLVAIVAEAMSGALAAGRRNMHISGRAAIASVLALDRIEVLRDGAAAQYG